MTSINFCDLTPDERSALLQEERDWKAKAHALLEKAYGDRYCRSPGGGSNLYRDTGVGYQWRHAPELLDAAAHWLNGTKAFWVRCGGAEMRCRMHEFPLFTVEEYLNSDTYGRKPIGSTIRPEQANEFIPTRDAS